MKRQAWWCEECGSRGYVDHDEHAGVFEVINAIRADHARHIAEGCTSERIRVQNEAWVEEAKDAA